MKSLPDGWVCFDSPEEAELLLGMSWRRALASFEFQRCLDSNFVMLRCGRYLDKRDTERRITLALGGIAVILLIFLMLYR